MSKHVIATDKAPAAIGPYSQAVRTGNLIFTAGQIPLDPATGQVVAGGIAEQTTSPKWQRRPFFSRTSTISPP
jgi:2-iminobutanoate/2-iminopropanoate deaminase